METQLYFMNNQDHPRTGGVTQEPRKTKENGVKNLLQATATSDFYEVKNVEWPVLPSLLRRTE